MRADVVAGCALALGTVLAGCAGVAPGGTTTSAQVREVLVLMDYARVVDGGDAIGLHNRLSGAVALDPGPLSRARLALALSVGERTPAELSNAARIIDELLDPRRTAVDSLGPELAIVLRVQRDALARRRTQDARIASLETTRGEHDSLLARERESRVLRERERDAARAALATARKRLRELMRIEVRHEAEGS